MSITALKRKSAARRNLSGGGNFRFGITQYSTTNRIDKLLSCCKKIHKDTKIDSASEKQYSSKLSNLKCESDKPTTYDEYIHFYKNKKVCDITK